MRVRFENFLELEYHENLNPLIFDSVGQIHEPIRLKLLENANAWIEFCKLPRDCVSDIVLTGGNCNFNWTGLSDLDVHVVVDPDKMQMDRDLFHDITMDKKSIWSDRHPDVRIVGYPVELYNQLADDPSAQGGIYSLTGISWVKKPKNLGLNFDNRNDLEIIVAALSKDIRQTIDLEEAKRIREALANLRSNALKVGDEFSDGNLIFKSLRNKGDLAFLSDLIRRLTDKQLSY